ncbi:MAG: hypothetical protein IKW86_07635 [Salinivirgaceae bacterium]|nr:hypothetical protein [Salinivirgaceae bacterium]
MDELTTKRLAVIKQLYLHGVEQSYEVEPMNGFSILSFHDSVEMFMKLCAEVKDVKIDRNVKFVEYFTKLPDMLCEATMTNLNSKRVNLKHYGSLPSQLDIEISRANVADFFEQNTPIFFDTQFDNISLISLVKYESVREYLEKSLSDISLNNYKDSITNSQIAFKELMYCHKEENTKYFKPLFGETHNFSSLTSFHLNIGLGREFDGFIDNVSKSIPELEENLNIIGLGIDYKRYKKFKLLSPSIHSWHPEGKSQYDVYINEDNDRRICNKRNASFCFDFVIESALKLQQFNVDIDETIM